MADAMEVLFDRFLIRPFDRIEDIAGFVGPAALEGDLAVDQGKGSQQAFSSVVLLPSVFQGVWFLGKSRNPG